MPKILVTAQKGLIQKAGTTATNGTITGNRTYVYPTVLEGKNALHLSASDSGGLFVLGGKGAGAEGSAVTDVTCMIPAMSTANIGWHATFAITGALESARNHHIRTQDSDDRFSISVSGIDGTEPTLLATDDKSGPDNILTASVGVADVDDSAVFEITYIAANKAVVFGNVLS
jgi:hypothetical protein